MAYLDNLGTGAGKAELEGPISYYGLLELCGLQEILQDLPLWNLKTLEMQKMQCEAWMASKYGVGYET